MRSAAHDILCIPESANAERHTETGRDLSAFLNILHRNHAYDRHCDMWNIPLHILRELQHEIGRAHV